MPTLEDVDVETVKAWLDADEAVVVDVREREEWDQARIAGATLNPMSAFDPAAIPEHDGKKLVFQCAMGGRSAQVAQYLVAHGHLDAAYNMAGGLKAWAEAGFAVETG